MSEDGTPKKRPRCRKCGHPLSLDYDRQNGIQIPWCQICGYREYPAFRPKSTSAFESAEPAYQKSSRGRPRTSAARKATHARVNGHELSETDRREE